MKMARLNLVGERFDKLLVIESVRTTPSGQEWLCRCDCGNECLKITTQLRRKVRKLGGCRACEIASRSETNTKHGGRKQNTVGSEAIYMVWKGMRARCADKNDPYYGGKGVTRGDRMTIDRIDPAIGYCPENCQWLTGRENSRRMALDHSSRKSADVVH